MVRLAKEDGELYAMVEKHLGNGQLSVKCIDGVQRICIIRKKFSHGKKKEQVQTGGWILVGLHEFTSQKQKCDLLEIYNAHDMQQLQMTDQPWYVFGIEKQEAVDFSEVETSKVVVATEINLDDI
jgi:initiation factor 1A